MSNAVRRPAKLSAAISVPPSGSDHHAVGEGHPVGDDARRAGRVPGGAGHRRLHQHDAAEARHVARHRELFLVEVRIGAADVGAARRVHHHVVAGKAAVLLHVGHHGGLAVTAGMQLAVVHRHHLQRAVGHPAEPGGQLRYLDDGLQGAVQRETVHRAAQDVGKEQPVVAPARSLGEEQPVSEDGRLAVCHSPHRIIDAPRPATGTVRVASAQSGAAGPGVRPCLLCRYACALGLSGPVDTRVRRSYPFSH